jgi:PAS domain S-box-containing protein
MDVANYVHDQKRTPGFRCKKCGKLLTEGSEHKIDIRCNRCGTLNRILEKMTEQVIITDKDGVILFVNKELEHITGYGIAEVLGKKPSLWGGQMPKEFYKEMWSTLIEKKQGVSVQVTNRKKTGEFYDALLQISPVLDTTGDIKFLVGIESVVSPKA